MPTAKGPGGFYLWKNNAIDCTILYGDGKHQLVEVKRWVDRTKVYKLPLHPDVAIETFSDTIANPISTKGSKIKNTPRCSAQHAAVPRPQR